MPLAKSVLILLGLTAAVSAVNSGIHEKTLRSGTSSSGRTIIISNKEM